MFIHEIYVSVELNHMLIGYEIVIFIRYQGEQDVLNIKIIMKRYQFVIILIVNLKHYYDIRVSVVLTGCIVPRMVVQ